MDARVNNNTYLMNELTDLLHTFQIDTMRDLQDLSGMIEDARNNGLLDGEAYDQLINREEFNIIWQELHDANCSILCEGMKNFLQELKAKMEEYESITI